MQGLQPLGAQGFFAAHGFFAAAFNLGTKHFWEPAPPLAAQGLHGLQAFLAAHGLQGLHWASCMNRGFGFAVGSRVGCFAPALMAPAFMACAGVDIDKAPPMAIPVPTKAGITVVDKSGNLNDLKVASYSQSVAEFGFVFQNTLILAERNCGFESIVFTGL